MKNPPQSVAVTGAAVHELHERHDRMDDLYDCDRFLNADLSLPSSLTSNAVEQAFSAYIDPPAATAMSIFEIITVCHM